LIYRSCIRTRIQQKLNFPRTLHLKENFYCGNFGRSDGNFEKAEEKSKNIKFPLVMSDDTA
jgi:hypothetical protein